MADEPQDAGWRKLGGATVHIGEGGVIDAGCEGLVGHKADPEHLEATRDQRDAKQKAAEAAGWESQEVKEARDLHTQASQHAGEGTLVFVRDGDTFHTFGPHAAKAREHLQMGDGEAASFKAEHLEDHLQTLVSKGHRVALVERTKEGGARPQAQVGPEHAGQLDTEAGDTASDPGRAPAVEPQAAQPEPWQQTRAQLAAHWTEPPANSMEPWKGTIPPPGTWRIDPRTGELEQLRTMDPKSLAFTEDPADVANADTTKAYTEWARQGMQPPPITAAMHADGDRIVSNNRRRLMAALATNQPSINTWYTANGLRPDTHRSQVEKALAAGQQVPPEVLADYPDLQPPPAQPVQPQKPKPMKPGDVVTWKSKTGPVDAEYRGKMIGQDGTQQAVVIVRNPGESPYQHTVPLSELSQKQAAAQVAQPPQGPRPGQKFPMPAVGDRPAMNLEVRSVGQDGTVALGLEGDPYDRVKVPQAALKHFVNDLAGKVDVPPNSGVPEIDAVASGQGEWLGKGDDGVAFGVGDKVVKVSTVVPFIPENYRGMLPEQAAARLEQQGAVQNELSQIHPGILPVQVNRHGDKSFLTMERVQPVDPKQATPEQLAQVRDIMKAMHGAGYSLNDDPQFGVDAGGLVKMFDTGKANRTTNKYDFEDDQGRLSRIFGQSGNKLTPWGQEAGRGFRSWEFIRDGIDAEYADVAKKDGTFAEALSSAQAMAEDDPEGSKQALAMLREDAGKWGFDFPEEPHPDTTRAAQAASQAPPKPKHLIDTLHKLPSVKTTGGGSAKLAGGYAEAMHEHLSSLQGGSDGFGTVHDLSDHLGPGAIGYHSPAGVVGLVPPAIDGDTWEARYSAQQTEDVPQWDTEGDLFDQIPEGGSQGDASEEDAAYEGERKQRVQQEVAKVAKQHPQLHAAVADAFPGDHDMQLAASEMAVAAWKPYAERVDEIKRGRADILNTAQMGGMRAAQIKQAVQAGRETQGVLSNFDQIINDRIDEYPALFKSWKINSAGLLEPVPGNLESDREAALLENLSLTNEQLTPPGPEHPAFLGGVLEEMARHTQGPEDEAVPFSRRAYYERALQRYRKTIAKEGGNSEHSG